MTGEVPTVEATSLARVFETPAGPVHALRSANLSILPGETSSIMGPSGSGKSTLLHLLGLMDEATSGSLLLAGHDVSALSKRARDLVRSQLIGFVFQSFHLIPHRRVVDNVALPLMYQGKSRPSRVAAAESALSRVGLSHRTQASPNTLSGGEKQRVAIARALVHNPRLILCDEPTGSLDSANAEEIVSLLRRLSNDGPSVLIVTHDPSVSVLTDSQYDMADGQLTLSRAPR